jgi:hypothetical protein
LSMGRCGCIRIPTVGTMGPIHDSLENNRHNQTIEGWCAMPEHKAATI